MIRRMPRRQPRLRWFVLAPLCALLLGQTPAIAAGGKLSPEEQEARALFDQGLALSDESRWSEALDAFKKSDKLVHSASVRFNMAVTLRALGRFVEAKRIAEELLARGVDDKPLKPALQKDVEKLRDEVAPKIVHVELRRNPADGSVEIDGTLFIVAADGRVELDPGKHVFIMRKEGYETVTVAQSVAGPEAVVVLTAPKINIAPPPEPPPFYKRGWFWGTVGGVVAAGAAIAVVAVVTTADAPAVAAPPPSTVGRVIPAAFTVRF